MSENAALTMCAATHIVDIKEGVGQLKELVQANAARRYQGVPAEKIEGATYTPKILADFVAQRIVEASAAILHKPVIRVLDPAVGDGELLLSILQHLGEERTVELYGFETNEQAFAQASERFNALPVNVSIHLRQQSFLDYVLDDFGLASTAPLFAYQQPEPFDIVIANPPYVRTQVMGASESQRLARQFNLNGRTDLYHAFLIALAAVLGPHGIAGVIVSNRFMTTKSGEAVRSSIQNNFQLLHVWDLGDTKLFSAAVLPAVLLLAGKNAIVPGDSHFTSIYETDTVESTLTVEQATDPIKILSMDGIVAVPDGRRFKVQHGKLYTNGIWRIATELSDEWLNTVAARTWGTFRDIGKIRVGVKTCADNVFIRSDWHTLTPNEQPELLRPLTTHHVARRFASLANEKLRKILYPHAIINGRRQTVDLADYPRTRSYLELYRSQLEARRYVLAAGRQWYEIWVPQDPAAWDLPKLVFRDISEQPTFWIDQQGTIVNGDCYWLIAERPGTEDLLWLALAIANSTFAEKFYDQRFHNKLYSGRRRFITQYVEQFPLPDPQSLLAKHIIETAKFIYAAIGTPAAKEKESILDALVFQAFGLAIEEASL